MAASARAQRQIAFNLRVNGRLERQMRKRIRKELVSRVKAASVGYRDDQFIGVENALRGHEDDVIRIVQDEYKKTAEIYGPYVIDSLKGVGAWRRKDFSDDMYAQFINNWLSDRKTDRIGHDIARRTRTLIRNLIMRGIEEGLTQVQIAKTLPKTLNGVNASVRAAIIARTEIHNAASFASDSAARASGIAKMEKEWVSINDARTRGYPDNDHAGADGNTVLMDDAFTFVRDDGTSYVLMRPGDPDGPANGVINCRCVLAYTPVD